MNILYYTDVKNIENARDENLHEALLAKKTFHESYYYSLYK